MKPEDRTPASQQLDHKAEQLAQRHQHRLNEMTDVALSSVAQRRHWLTPQPALAFATLSLFVLVWWGMPSPENSLSPPAASQMAAIPNWVLDEEVPLDLLESAEFYRWLAEQTAPATEQEQTTQQG